MTIEVKNDAMLGRNTDSTLHIELIKLQQENQQLKKQNARLTREVCNRLIANYDYSSTFKDELNKERINNIVLKEANKLTNEENEQLKEVIDEVWNFIKKYPGISQSGVMTIKQILDKVGDNNV